MSEDRPAHPVAAVLAAFALAACGSGSSNTSSAGAGTDGSAPTDSGGAGTSCTPACSIAAPSTVACVAGRCVATLATGANGAMSLAVDATSVYWIGNAGLWSVPIAGGAARQLDTGSSAALYGLLAIDSTYAYWPSNAALQRTALDGSGSTPLVSNTQPLGVATGGGYVAWTGGSGSINAVSTSSTASPTRLASSQNAPAGLTLGGGIVYFANGGYAQTGGGGIESVPIAASDAATATSLASDNGGPLLVAADGSNVYWCDFQGGLYAVPLAGGARSTIVQGAVSSFAIDSANVYYSDQSGTIIRAPLSGGGATMTLASGLGFGRGVAVDGTSVYVTDHQGGTVTRITPK